MPYTISILLSDDAVRKCQSCMSNNFDGSVLEWKTNNQQVMVPLIMEQHDNGDISLISNSADIFRESLQQHNLSDLFVKFDNKSVVINLNNAFVIPFEDKRLFIGVGEDNVIVHNNRRYSNLNKWFSCFRW